MKDAAQKEMLYKHFRAKGWYALVEVPVYYRAGMHGSQKLVTDIDVLAFAPSPDLRWQSVLGDCKTKRGESPANRALWLSGLMQRVSADRGVLILKKDGASVEPDHRAFADAMSISLVEEKDFNAYDRALIYPAGSQQHPESAASLQRVRQEVQRRYTRLGRYCEYLSSTAWNEPDHYVLMRSVIAEARRVHAEIDPSKPEHLAIVLEGASVFSVAFATCIGAVFRQFLALNDRSELDSALKVIIWGGRQQYDYVASLRQKVIAAKGSADQSALALPEWSTFMQLVRSHLDSPHFTFREPDILRMASLDLFSSSEFLAGAAQADPMLLKLSMLTVLYYLKASQFPPETASRVQELFVARMATLVAT